MEQVDSWTSDTKTAKSILELETLENKLKLVNVHSLNQVNTKLKIVLGPEHQAQLQSKVKFSAKQFQSET